MLFLQELMNRFIEKQQKEEISMVYKKEQKHLQLLLYSLIIVTIICQKIGG